MGQLSERFVYVFQASNGLCKVGSSKNPAHRLHVVQNMSPLPIRMVHCLSAGPCFDTEWKIQDYFASKRRHGEWFELSDEEVENFEDHFRKATDVPQAVAMKYPTRPYIFFTPDVIRQVRAGTRLTQEAFAVEMNVSQNCVARWERGTSHPHYGRQEQLYDLVERYGLVGAIVAYQKSRREADPGNGIPTPKGNGSPAKATA